MDWLAFRNLESVGRARQVGWSVVWATSTLASLGGCGSENPAPTKAGSPDAGFTASQADASADAAAADTMAAPEPPGPHPSPVPDDCITSVAPGMQQLMCEGLTFDMLVPESCLETACGLIFDVHGFGMNGALENQHSRLQELAGPAGYIVVNPYAPGDLLSAAWNESHDAQVFAIMQRVMNVWHVDPKRVHFGGYSMGGWMTWRFICKHADVIASAAPIAAGAQATGCFDNGQQPAEQIPIFYTHGTTDGLVSFDTAIPQRDAVIESYGLDQTEVLQSGADYEWTRYTNAAGNLFEFAQHDWACDFNLGNLALKGHCFPGSGLFLGCGADNPLNWGELVLAFYQAHPKP